MSSTLDASQDFSFKARLVPTVEIWFLLPDRRTSGAGVVDKGWRDVIITGFCIACIIWVIWDANPAGILSSTDFDNLSTVFWSFIIEERHNGSS
jgi:hypothetical protein